MRMSNRYYEKRIEELASELRKEKELQLKTASNLRRLRRKFKRIKNIIDERI